MSDINIFKRPHRGIALVIPQSERGRKWMEDNFVGELKTITIDVVEDFIKALQEEELTVETY